MEEDIKILKKIREESINAAANACTGAMSNIWRKEAQAIENLLKRYKELEEENKRLKAFEDFKLKNDYIHISVIQNKINAYLEYDKIYKTHTSDGRENFTMEYFKAKALQELLEERNK